MAEYIEREAALNIFASSKDNWKSHEAAACISAIPAADVVKRDCFDRLLEENDMLRATLVPVRHGHWNRKEKGLFCSECGLPSGFIRKIEVEEDGLNVALMTIPYCPHCGAKMDGAEC